MWASSPPDDANFYRKHEPLAKSEPLPTGGHCPPLRGIYTFPHVDFTFPYAKCTHFLQKSNPYRRDDVGIVPYGRRKFLPKTRTACKIGTASYGRAMPAPTRDLYISTRGFYISRTRNLHIFRKIQACTGGTMWASAPTQDVWLYIDAIGSYPRVFLAAGSQNSTGVSRNPAGVLQNPGSGRTKPDGSLTFVRLPPSFDNSCFCCNLELSGCCRCGFGVYGCSRCGFGICRCARCGLGVADTPAMILSISCGIAG